MKYATLLFIFNIIPHFIFCQYKIVKLDIDSSKTYLRYYYKSRYHSDEILNDSVTIIGRKISDSSFYLDKIVNKQKLWTRIYKIVPANDSLRITTKAGTINGKHKFIRSKQMYYNSFEIK